MDRKLPHGILSESDLEDYGKYLKELDAEAVGSEGLAEYLKKQKGKYITVEPIICGRLAKRSGRLISVGDGHIVIKSGNGTTVCCMLEDIKLVTVFHGTVR